MTTKKKLKGEFHEWYSTQVLNSLNDDDYSVIATQVNSETSSLKLSHVQIKLNTNRSDEIKVDTMYTDTVLHFFCLVSFLSYCGIDVFGNI